MAQKHRSVCAQIVQPRVQSSIRKVARFALRVALDSVGNKHKKGEFMNWTTNMDPKVKELELRHNPVIIRVNKFDEESANEFAMKMALAHNTGQPIIPVVIDSYGGQVYSLMSMISAIRASELPVSTIVEGKAMSCGVVLFSMLSVLFTGGLAALNACTPK